MSKDEKCTVIIGQKVRHKVIEAFEGIVIAHAHYLYNQDRIGVQSLTLQADGKPMEPIFFDMGSLIVVGESNLTIPDFPELTINFKDIVKDKLTDFEGTVTGIAYWFNGCIRIGVLKKTLNKDGEPSEEVWLPMDQTEVIKKAKKEEKKGTPPGGPMSNPTSSCKDPK